MKPQKPDRALFMREGHRLRTTNNITVSAHSSYKEALACLMFTYILYIVSTRKYPAIRPLMILPMCTGAKNFNYPCYLYLGKLPRFKRLFTFLSLWFTKCSHTNLFRSQTLHVGGLEDMLEILVQLSDVGVHCHLQ